ncbi:IS5 family transposase [Streptomyces inhibens]|uniref:IS5 family transposase n=1 Tax=Streptomyces inhibens TaxID=2293571 RepID=UPI003798A4DE
MPAVPSCLLEPVWEQFAVLLPARPDVHPDHPLGCHRRRIPDRLVSDRVVEKLVYGAGYERIAACGCSDWTIRDRVKEWSRLGPAKILHRLVLAAYEKMIGLDLDDLSADGCITKAPCDGETVGPSPVDRRKQGLKRSVATDGEGVPVGLAAAGANRHDSKLLEPTLESVDDQVGSVLPEYPTIQLDSAYNGRPCAEALEEHGLVGEIAVKGVKAPIQAGRRWVVERTHSWMNGYSELRRFFQRTTETVEFYLYLAAAFVTVRCLIRQARNRYRWDTRPETRRLK